LRKAQAPPHSASPQGAALKLEAVRQHLERVKAIIMAGGRIPPGANQVGLFLFLLMFATTACITERQIIQISGVSMGPSYPDGSTLWIEEIEPRDLVRGDLVYFEL
jgi:hypothetical protein